MMMENQEELFQVADIGILFGSAMAIVIVAVYSVVFSNKGVQE
jgi:tetrahydromethanopterin S-methyltransferase subunit G